MLPCAPNDLAQFAALAALVAAHLTLASSLTPRRRWLAGAVTSAVLFAGEIEDVAAALKGRVDALAERMAASAGG